MTQEERKAVAELVELAVSGRITAEAVEQMAGQVWPRIERGERFLVLFDRSEMTAPTAEGRAAVEELYGRWDRIAPHVIGWADVYDARRASSLAGAEPEEDDDHGDALPYPHELFSDVEAARSWLRGLPH